MKAKYGLRALTILAKEYGKGPVLIADLATKERIPRKFLELILLELKKKGILQSKKGKGGGYYLSRPPATVSVGELIRALDGPLALLPCVSQTAYRRCDECPDEQTCGIRSLIKEARLDSAHIRWNQFVGRRGKKPTCVGAGATRHVPHIRSCLAVGEL